MLTTADGNCHLQKIDGYSRLSTISCLPSAFIWSDPDTALALQVSFNLRHQFNTLDLYSADTRYCHERGLSWFSSVLQENSEIVL